MACTKSIVDENLDYCPTDEIAAGVSPVNIYGAFISDFDAIQELPALNVATSLAEAATIDTAHTFLTNKGFHKLNVLPDTGLVESVLVGEKGSKSVINSFAGTLPGTSARNKGYGRLVKNQGMIFLVTQINGDVVQIGSKNSPAYFEEYAPASGAKPEDVNGVPFKISAVDVCPAPVYTGTITEFTPA